MDGRLLPMYTSLPLQSTHDCTIPLAHCRVSSPSRRTGQEALLGTSPNSNHQHAIIQTHWIMIVRHLLRRHGECMRAALYSMNWRADAVGKGRRSLQSSTNSFRHARRCLATDTTSLEQSADTSIHNIKEIEALLNSVANENIAPIEAELDHHEGPSPTQLAADQYREFRRQGKTLDPPHHQTHSLTSPCRRETIQAPGRKQSPPLRTTRRRQQPSFPIRRHPRAPPILAIPSRPLILPLEPGKRPVHLRHPRRDPHHLTRCHSGLPTPRMQNSRSCDCTGRSGPLRGHAPWSAQDCRKGRRVIWGLPPLREVDTRQLDQRTTNTGPLSVEGCG